MSQSPYLQIDHLSKSFGGLAAVSDVNLSFNSGDVNAIIGPNGAGKTTLFNLITGFIKSDSGVIKFEGQDITNLKPFEISRVGVKRTLQIKSIFPSMTTYENLWVTANAHSQNLHPFSDFTGYKSIDEKVSRVIEDLNLQRIAHTPAGSLSYGDVAVLEIGMAMIADPKLILFDEPVCGMSPAETEKVVEQIIGLSKKIHVIIIEHDMEVVFKMADQITVMAFGKVFATGTPNEISNHAGVKEIYFGSDELELS
jgi:branched-chain amino acid transport system ATP-binding protein